MCFGRSGGCADGEVVLMERLRWMGVGGNRKDVKRGGGETSKPCDAHGCLAAKRVEGQLSERSM